MRNLQTLFFASLFFFPNFLSAQNTLPERQADFGVSAEGQGIRFTPVMPPLAQRAGAPKAYYEYFWEFGDGSFSKEDNPVHIYSKPGEYMASADAIAHYDTGKKAKKKKKPVKAAGALAGTEPTYIFEEKSKQAIAMGASARPKAEEEITLVISYRNNSFVTTDGRLHLFFNEKKYPSEHFQFTDARTHFGEVVDPLLSEALPVHSSPMERWVAIPLRTYGGANISWSDDYAPFSIVEDMLRDARGAYREEKAWRFTEFAAGEKRNLFVSLACTPNMVRDTHAFVHLEAVFAPTDPVVAAERFVMEIEIVSAHDPNAIAVSDNRVNYRTLGKKNLSYKVQFQNNGEGPASTVEVKVEIPKGLNMARMRPMDWHPKCPICPETPGNESCLDTASTKTGLTFTFRNIYLPGSRQKDVDSRDSTKGFVKYRIEAEKNMPKLPFSSRAKIVFDKEPPIYTNFTKTQFKPGISPGIKVGYNYDFDIEENDEEYTRMKPERFVFLGLSLSPFKSWRVYPQIELLTGIKRSSFLPDEISRGLADSSDAMGHKVTYQFDTLITRERGFVSFEIPFLLRKNFNRAFGLGLGSSARIILENGQDCIHVSTTKSYAPPLDVDFPPETTRDTIRIFPHSLTRVRFTVFGDLTFGAVRAGPNFGIRGGVVLVRQRKWQPFVQASVEMKL